MSHFYLSTKFDKKLLLRPAKVFLLFIFTLFSYSVSAQSVNIKGQVVDIENIPIIGATVVVKGKNIGTVTDIDGNYNLSASVGDVLEITYVGYDSKTLTVVSGTTDYNIQLSAGLALDEVVVIG